MSNTRAESMKSAMKTSVFLYFLSGVAAGASLIGTSVVGCQFLALMVVSVAGFICASAILLDVDASIVERPHP